MDKPALRTSLRAALRDLPPLVRAEQEELVNAILLNAVGAAKTVLVYKAKAPELSLVSFTNALFVRGFRVLMPKVDGKQLRLQVVSSWDDLQAGAFGIEEPRPECPEIAPEELDFAVIPGLGFSTAGDRLGQGGGFYDRILPSIRCPTWGAAFDCQMGPVPREPHDVPVQNVAWAGSLFT